MLGAISGDVAGSVYEFHPWQGAWQDIKLFTPKSEFTDDTVLTVATARALMDAGGDRESFHTAMIDRLHEYSRKYPRAGYGAKYAQWFMQKSRTPYNSFGNGSAMRVSPIGWAFDSLPEVEQFAESSASVTHNHPEGIKGACAVAGAIFLARKGESKAGIKIYVSEKYGYDLDRTLEQIRENYRFNETCQESVPEAIIAFLEADKFEDTLKKAIWLRGDADTQADIAGAIAEAFYGGVPENIRAETYKCLDDDLREVLAAWDKWLQNRN